MSARSWDHAAGTLSEQTVAYNRKWARACSWPRCDSDVTHWTSYSYTGRAGRVTRAAKLVCRTHAERFASKHDVEVTAMDPYQTALAKIVEEPAGGAS